MILFLFVNSSYFGVILIEKAFIRGVYLKVGAYKVIYGTLKTFGILRRNKRLISLKE